MSALLLQAAINIYLSFCMLHFRGHEKYFHVQKKKLCEIFVFRFNGTIEIRAIYISTIITTNFCGSRAEQWCLLSRSNVVIYSWTRTSWIWRDVRCLLHKQKCTNWAMNKTILCCSSNDMVIFLDQECVSGMDVSYKPRDAEQIKPN